MNCGGNYGSAISLRQKIQLQKSVEVKHMRSWEAKRSMQRVAKEFPGHGDRKESAKNCGGQAF
jgi:hypothetical protein